MNNINDSFDLYYFLHKQDLLRNHPINWWPSNSAFDIILGAILTQNTKWQNVEQSFKNLKKLNINSFETLLHLPMSELVLAITPSGFKNQKSQRLKKLAKNVIEEFESFDEFLCNVSREWLLSQTGIGFETADAILCYACLKDEMVVDKYTNRLVNRCGFEFENYEELKSWCEYGINENFDKITRLYENEITLNLIFSRFHGMIVEYMKRNPKD